MSGTSASADSFSDGSTSGMSPVAATVYELLAPVVATVGVELIDVDWNGGTLQVIIDNADGVTIDNLAEVNRLVSPILDQHDPVPGRYTLEVSSPGVERPLRRLEHFRRAIGEDVIIKSMAHVEPRRVKGGLEAVSDTDLTVNVVEVDGVELAEPETRTVTIADISTAKTVFEWGPTPKLGGKNNKSKQQPKSKKKQSGGTARSGKSQPNTAQQERGQR